MAKVEEHPETVLVGDTREEKVTISKVNNMVKCGTTYLCLGEIAAIEFRLDEDENVDDYASIQWKGVGGDAWEMPKEDAQLLKALLDKGW